MPVLTVYKTVTYTDPDSDTPFTMTATKELNCETGQRARFTLSSGANTQIYANNTNGLTTANPLYVAIKNVGAGSAYIHLNDGANPFQHEIPAGAIFDFFGEDIYGNVGPDTLESIYAKGNTELEVDVFM
jgi:hypothetical protein